MKNSAIPYEQSISGYELIKRATSVIRSAETLVGGRHVLIECYNNPKLLKFYKDNYFKPFTEIPYGEYVNGTDVSGTLRYNFLIFPLYN